jgi:hypothetical protein
VRERPPWKEVRILPAWSSPKVWPLVIVLVGTVGLLVAVRLWDVTPVSGTVWPYLLVMLAAIAWRFRSPVVILRPDGIGVFARNAADESDLGIAWNRRIEEPDVWHWVPADSIADWRRDDFGIRMRLRAGRDSPLETSVAFTLRGIRPADRERIVAWLTEHVGG